MQSLQIEENIEENTETEKPTSSPAQLDSTTKYTTGVVEDHPLNNSEVSQINPHTVESKGTTATVESTGTTDNIEYRSQGQITKMPAVASTDCSKNPQSELCVQIRNTYIPTKVIPSGVSTPDSDHDPCGDTLASAASSNCLNWGGLRSSGLDEFLQSMKKGNLDVFQNDEASMFNKRKFTNFQTATSMLKDTKLLGARTAFGLLISLATNILSQTRQHRVEGSIYQRQDEERNYLLSIPSFVLALLYMLILAMQIRNWLKFRNKRKKQKKAKQKSDVEGQSWTELQNPYGRAQNREMYRPFVPR